MVLSVTRRDITAQVPNAISLARLAAGPFLLWMAYAEEPHGFRWLLLICLLSDIADGLIARRFQLTSVLGARLDSTADQLTTVAALAGLFAFEANVLRDHWLAFTSVVVFYLASDAAAVMRYGKIASFHTLLARAAAYAQGIFIMTLLFGSYREWLMNLMVAVSHAAYFEEIAIIAWVLPQWRADVRGRYWLLAKPAREDGAV
jgi:CDP-diacylglycerol--glycerol-3-phosphate 3-phosphatidyltransferase